MEKAKKIGSDFPEFKEAHAVMMRNLPGLRVETVPLSEASQMVLAESVKVPIDAPPFDQSAMDGFAFNFKAWDQETALIIADAIPAGKFSTRKLQDGTAARIFTGAPVPAGADTVVIKEKVKEVNGKITIQDSLLIRGANIRKQGSHVKAGQLAGKKYQQLSVGAIAYLAAVGIAKVKVFAKPRISIIVTGNELTPPGKSLKKGNVFECNSFGLTAALAQMKIQTVAVSRCRDDEDELKKSVKNALRVSDMLILTGGVSVGDYDFVAAALQQCGVIKKFHKVKQKPGKPLYFGLHGSKLVFGLPGNPASVLSCFYTFVVKAISAATKVRYDDTVMLPALNTFTKKGSLTTILKAKTSARGVEILNDQESYKLNSFAEADALVILPPEISRVERGDLLEVLLIDN